MVVLSFRTRRTVVKGAIGPLTKNRTASCGRYVKKNMPPMTPVDRSTRGPSLETKGFQSERWERK